jgi:signal transduction histidine kinase
MGEKRMTQPTPELVLRMLLHDLRSPLVALVYNAQMLLEAPDLSADSRDLAEDILGAAMQAQRTITAAVEIRRKMEGTLSPASAPIDVRPVVRDALATFTRRAAERGQTLMPDGALAAPSGRTPPGGALVARTDRDLCKLLVETLIDLSLRSAPRDSEVRIWLGTAADEVEIRIHDQRGDERGAGQSISHLLVAVAHEVLGARITEEGRSPGHVTRVRFPKA